MIADGLFFMNLLLALDLSILSDEDVFKRMYMKMRPFRKEKIDRIKGRSGKCQSLGAGILLEEALKRAGRSEKEISYKKSGKPYISDDEKIFLATIVDKFYDADKDETTENKYTVALFALDMNKAHQVVRDYMKQGLEDMELVGLKCTKVVDVLK